MKHLAEKLIELRKMATKVYHSKMKHMTDYLFGEDGDGDFVMAEFNRGMPNWKNDIEFCLFAANHAADIAERMLRLEKALKKCKEQRTEMFLKARDYPDQCGEELILLSIYEQRCNGKIEAILRGES